MKLAKGITRGEAMKQHERRPKAWNEALSRAHRESVSTSVVVDRNVKRKHCALDFDTLDCPICLESLVPPVYQCQNGHTVCAGCCKMLDKGSCPSCSLPIGTNRCIAVEKIIESLQVHCKYAIWGCKGMLQFSSKSDEHEALCEFRPCWCPVVDCTYEGLKSGLHRHFDLVHNVVEVEQEAQTEYNIIFLTKDSAYDKSHSQYAVLQVFEHDDEDKDVSEYVSLFLVHHQFHEEFCRYSISCTSFGVCRTYRGELIRYHLAVDFEKTGGFKYKHSTEGRIHDNQKDHAILSKVVRQGDCLLVPKLHPQQKESPQFNVKVSLSFEDVDEGSE